MLNWLNYHHLRYFVAIVEEGGVARAASALGVSHPTVSEQLHKLEAHLDMRLMERRGRNLELTEQGRMVYDYASQIFGIGAALLAEVDGRHTGKTVIGRLGVDSVLPKLTVKRLLSPLFDEFDDRLRLRCVEDEREKLLGLLSARRIDVVLSDTPAFVSTGRHLRSSRLATSHVSCFAAPALAARYLDGFPASLNGAPFLLPMPTTRLRRELERWMGEQGIQPIVVAEIEDSGLLKAFGQDGRGIFAMPSNVSEEICRQYDVLELGQIEGVELQIHAITGPSPHDHILTRRLLELHAASSIAS